MSILAVQNNDKNQIDNLEKLTNVDAEIAVIGCLLWDNRSFEKIADFLDEIHFSDENNREIFRVIKNLLNKNILVTPITLKNHLQNNNFKDIDILAYLNQIKETAPSSYNTEQFAQILYDLHIKRSLISIGNEIINKSINNQESEDGKTLIEEAENNLYNLSQIGNIDRKHLSFKDALKNAVNIIDNAFKREGKIAGLPTGLMDLDKKLGGLHKSDLIIIAGRPSMGKTALGTNIAFNVASSKSENDLENNKNAEKYKVAFFSLEMSSEQLATRILAEQTKISSDKMRKGDILQTDWKKIVEISSELEELSLFIDDNPILTIPSLRARARRLNRLYGIDLIIIDYLQLMSGSNNNRNDGRVQEISEITRGLKAIAKEINIPIIALSQLSRQVEQREDKKPQLSDLRESGTIEQDADVVMFIFRESYYLERKEPMQKPDETDEKYRENHERWKSLCDEKHNLAELIIAKQRHGPIGTINTHFDGNYTKFSNLSNKYDNLIE
ncbi:MAG: Replicative DNA helicase [Alphaproteobacteria bacterium MarineAlpha5_Bin9]|nr:MAG: Replicative DNA helicase [Alphaproteobacteria bacterium MarineAlpha5_Bin9]|tara:strand:- start:46218 stop:47717 length:1500 start_codon:yes stop_codon:yes gene_type:complete